MGEIRLPRHMFLWCLSAIYMFAFASLYVQIPGLYGNEGVLPARWQLRVSGKSVVEQLKDSPTLLWFGPRLGLDTQQCMELLSLTGALLSLMTLALPVLRDCRVFLVLWILYLSLYQVGQVFLYFQWDNLLLEMGFLAILIAPMKMPWSSKVRLHDSVTFWLARWLLFRLMFASGVVKLNSRCPTWWGLTALTYHYETQCIPTPLAWFAHQLPVWFQKLSVVGMFVIEIAVPFMFFSPIRRHRLVAFYMQVLLQLFIILSGNYNFFNILTITLCMSLLDDQHVNFWLRRSTPKTETSFQTLFSWLAVMLEIGTCALLGYWSVRYFDLQVDWENKSVSSKTGFTYFEFNGFLKTVTVPSIWIGVLSLTWEIISAMFKCAFVRGVLWRLWNTIQWAVMAAATVSMFAVSLVPYTYIEYDAHSNLWPGIRTAFEVTERYQLVNSYGLFRRMTGVGGRPEVVIEGSMDRNTWTEIEFMYKPGNMSAAPPVVTPHQPRLDWQMWFAALGPHAQSPWFSSLLHSLLQGKRDVIRLIQTDESQYPFSKQPPAYLRAHRYKYWFSESGDCGGHLSKRWWRRVYVEEFYPMVHLGDSYLEQMLVQHGLKVRNKSAVKSESVIKLGHILNIDNLRGVQTDLKLTVCYLQGSLIQQTHESLQNKHADKQVTGWTHSNVAQEDAKKQEEEKDDAEEDRKEQEEDATSEEEQEGDIEEEVNTEETDVDSLRKRK
uniref:Lipase maturation factor n=1 Tax=Sinocyclocheilus grahami TaxID=75366 RepID=A0A672PIW1_SINGR